MTRNQEKSVAKSIHYVLGHGKLLAKQTKRDYKHVLLQAMSNLDKAGFSLRKLNSLKQRHISCLVTIWKEENLATRTIKNRLSALSYACETLGKQNVVRTYRDYLSTKEKSQQKTKPTASRNRAIDTINLEKVSDPYIKASLTLQQAFGLRREECLKIKPQQAHQGDTLVLQASWTKGGIARHIPIISDAQRHALQHAKNLAGNQSLIPQHKTYIQQRQHYDSVAKQQGFKNLHGLRHAYAQRRYAELTQQLSKGHGWQAPINGGPAKKALTAQQKIIDRQARKILSKELGHGRPYVTKVYLN